MTNQNPLMDRLQGLTEDGGQLAREIEMGQAETPMTALFEQLRQAIDSDVLHIVLLGLTAEARNAALAWLIGKEFSSVSIDVISQLGLVEIRLSEQGFWLERGPQQLSRFDHVEAFLDALKNGDLLKAGDGVQWAEPLRLGLPEVAGLRGLTLAVPGSTGHILQTPGLISRLLTPAHLLVVAAPLRHQLSETDRQAIDELSTRVQGVWPLLQVDELAEDIAMPDIGWWQGFHGKCALVAPKLLTTHVRAQVPALLNRAGEQMRTALQAGKIARRLSGAVEALQERQTLQERQLQLRAEREQRSAQASGNSGDVSQKKSWDSCRALLQDELQALLRSTATDTASNAATTTGRGISNSVMLERLGIDDIVQEPAANNIRLSLAPSTRENLRDMVVSTVSNQGKQRLASHADALRNLQARLRQQCAAVGESAEFGFAPLTSTDLQQAMPSAVALEVKYRGEMPKRGVWQRLGEGRKAVFGLLMMGSLVGPVLGFNLRTSSYIGLLFVIVFTGGIIYTFSRWKREDAERLELELEKVRDAIRQDLKRVRGELEQAVQGVFVERTDAIRKQWLRELDDTVQRHQAKQQNELEQDRQLSREKQKVSERQSRQYEQFRQKIRQLLDGCQRAEREVRDTLAKMSA